MPNATASTAGCANEEPVSKYTHPDRGPAKHAHAKPKKVLSAEQLKALEALKQASCQPRKLPAKTGQPTMSPKIELMRLKSKASGNANIAMADRLYLSVQWQDRSLPVFINKNTKVGSAALQFSKLLRLSQLPDKVYRLHVPEAAVPLPSNQLFSELMPSGSSDGGLFNGCTLELKCL